MLDTLVLKHAVSLSVTAHQCLDVESTHLYSLCINAVWTTLGCCAAAAAPTAGAELPLLFCALLSESPFANWLCACVWCVGVRCWRSVLGAVRLGGPMAEVEDGVMSMRSCGGASEPEDGRMGMERCMFGLLSPENGLLRASATEAIEWRRGGGGWQQC